MSFIETNTDTPSAKQIPQKDGLGTGQKIRLSSKTSLPSRVTLDTPAHITGDWKHLISNIIVPNIFETVIHHPDVPQLRKLAARLACTTKNFFNPGDREHVEQKAVNHCLQQTLDKHTGISDECIHDLCDTMLTLKIPLKQLKHQQLTDDVKECLQKELNTRILQYSTRAEFHDRGIFEDSTQAKPSQSNFEIRQCLLLVGADVNTSCAEHKNTLLHNAAILGHFKTIKLLLSYGADINAINTGRNTPLDEAADRLGFFSITRMRCALALVGASQNTGAKFQGFLRILKGLFPVGIFLFATTVIVTGLTLIVTHLGWGGAISAILGII